MHVNYSSDIAKNRNLKSNLTQSYRDAIGRLNLHSIPPCLFNLKHCAANHSSKEMQLLILPRVEVVATQLLDDGHYSQFILYARDCILSRSRFPGRRIIKAILEAILVRYPRISVMKSKRRIMHNSAERAERWRTIIFLLIFNWILSPLSLVFTHRPFPKTSRTRILQLSPHSTMSCRRFSSTFPSASGDDPISISSRVH